jgi:hypothetical protein
MGQGEGGKGERPQCPSVSHLREVVLLGEPPHDGLRAVALVQVQVRLCVRTLQRYTSRNILYKKKQYYTVHFIYRTGEGAETCEREEEKKRQQSSCVPHLFPVHVDGERERGDHPLGGGALQHGLLEVPRRVVGQVQRAGEAEDRLRDVVALQIKRESFREVLHVIRLEEEMANARGTQRKAG